MTATPKAINARLRCRVGPRCFRNSACHWSTPARDRRAIRWLTKGTIPNRCAELEHAPFTPTDLRDLVLALRSTLCDDEVAGCLCPCAEGAEVVAAVASRFVRREDVRRV